MGCIQVEAGLLKSAKVVLEGEPTSMAQWGWESWVWWARGENWKVVEWMGEEGREGRDGKGGIP
jgi:hypothetical protein